MSDSGHGDPVQLSDTQRRVRRSPLLFTAPLVLLGLLAAVLIWETIRANMTDQARGEWPWRLQLLGVEALGSLLAVAAGAVLARAQYARTVRPYLGWRGMWTKGDLGAGVPAWRVGILNAGQHIALIEAWDCQVVLRGQRDAGGAPWVDVTAAVERLTAAGFVATQDFRITGFGTGFPLVGTGSHETVMVGAFSRRCVEGIDAFRLRVRVTDVVGDSHERILDCMKYSRAADAEPVE